MSRWRAGCVGLLLLGGLLVWAAWPSSADLGPAHAASVPLADPHLVRFVAVGDTGKGNDGQRLVAKAIASVCAERGCDFALLLGDTLYPEGMDTPDDPRMAALTTEMYDLPLYLALGNHDYGRGHQQERAQRQVDWANRTDRVVLPARTYRFSAGPVTFWALDTDEAFWNGHEPQTRWLTKELSHSDAPFKVVFGHHPFRSNGRHGNAGTYDDLSSVVPVASGSRLKPLFEGPVCEQADLYVSGHDHNRQWIDWCDMTLIVSGAGASPTEVIPRGNTPRFARGTLGFTWFSATPEAMEIAFYDGEGTLEYTGRVQPRP